MLRLKPPRQGKSPNYSIRGTYLGVAVDRTTGTPNEAVARQVLKAEKLRIERSVNAPPVDPDKPRERTFEEAALAYLKAGGDRRYLGKWDPLAKVWIGGVIPQADRSRTLPGLGEAMAMQWGGEVSQMSLFAA